MFNWIDFLIILIILLYAYSGYRQGFLRMLVDIIGIVISLIIALKFYNLVAEIFTGWGLNQYLAKPIGFFVLWVITQVIFWLIAMMIFHYVPTNLHSKKINKFLGIIPGIFKGLIIVGIFLIVFLVLPFSSTVKNQLTSSLIGGNLIKSTAKVENQMEVVLGQFNNTLTFVGTTVSKPGETTKLNFSTDKFEIDADGENEMLTLLNQERAKNNLLPLKIDVLIRNVARAHSMDMVQKGYFAHEDLAGLTPADRMTLSHVAFQVAGENIALAPSIDLANIGLMNSPQHRKNILDPEFGRVGIGVIDAGPYGLMITQDFAD